MPRIKNKPSSERTQLQEGPASVWISKPTHRALRAHAQTRGQKMQWLADHLIRRGLDTSSAN